MICEGCGQGAPLVTGPVETRRNEYKRCLHFSDWLANFQGKENKRVPREIIDAVIREGAKISGELTRDKI